MAVKTLRITSRTSEAAKVHEAVLLEVAARGYSADAQFAIRLALDEALANAICHGNRQNPQKQVLIKCDANEDSVQIMVQDEGCGFIPSKVPNPTKDENLEKPHGRGIMLMRAYMSKVCFNENGTCVTLIKHRDCKRPGR